MNDFGDLDTAAGVLIGTILGSSLYGIAVALVLIFA